MHAALLIPMVLLICVLIGTAMALLADQRTKQFQVRVAALVPTPDTTGGVSRQDTDIRTKSEAGAQVGSLLLRLLRVPVDLPDAHVIPPRVVWAVGVVLAVTTVLLLLPYQPPLRATGLGLLLGVLVLRTVFGWEQSHYRKLLLRQLPDAIELVVSVTRAGLPISEAFRSVANELPAPTSVEFSRIVNQIALGGAAEDALLAVHNRTRVAEYAIFAVTIGVQMRSGGRLAETIQTLAETVRQRLSMAQRARALASEARASAVILISLPFVGGLLLSVINPGYLNPLFHDPRGVHMLTYAAIGVVLGMWSMRQLITRATRE